MKITRRELAAALAVPAARAQQPAAASADEELKAAKERIRSTSDALSRQSVPMAVEPAFQFKP